MRIRPRLVGVRNSPDQLGMAPAPAATIVPAPDVSEERATNAAKPVAKAKARVPDQKLAAGPNN